MTTEQEPEHTTHGGGLRYALIGLLLLGGGGVGIWLALSSGGQPKQESQAEAEPEPEDAGPARSTSLAEQDLVLPESTEDAGQDGGAEQDEERTRRRRRRARPRGSCQGNIDAKEALGVINEHRRQVRQCYERRLKVNPSLKGRFVVRMRIESSGSVGAVKIEGSLQDREVFSCVRGLARQWQFPKPEGGCAVMDAPFNFTPKE